MSTQPPGPVEPYLHRSAWTADAVRAADDWMVEPGAAHNAELRDVLKIVRASGLGIPAFGAADFPLPKLAPLLHGVRDEVVSWAERYEDMDLWQRNPMPPVFDLSVRRSDLVH